MRRKIAVAVMAALIVMLTAAPAALANPGNGNSLNTNRGTSQNGWGDNQNVFAGSKNYGWSFAKGDGLN